MVIITNSVGELRCVIKKLINVTFQVHRYLSEGKVILVETTGDYEILHVEVYERGLEINLVAYTLRYILDYELRRTAR